MTPHQFEHKKVTEGNMVPKKKIISCDSGHNR